MNAGLLVVVALARFCGAQAVPRDPVPVTEMSLDEYIQEAIRQGILGREAVTNLDTAVLAKGITYRQTSMPTLASNLTGSLSQTTTLMPGQPNTVQQSRNGQTGLTLTEPLPTGTVFTATSLLQNTLPAFTFAPGGDNNQYSVSAVQPIYLLVQNPVWRTRQRANLQFDSAQDSYDQELISIQTMARSFYYAVMIQETTLEVEQRKLAGSRALLEVTRALVDAGKSAPIEATRADIQYGEDARQVKNAKLSLDKAVLNAKDFISMPLDQEVRFTTRLEFSPLTLGLNRIMDYAMTHNQQLKVLRRSVDLAQFDLAQAKEPTLPTFALNGGYNWGYAQGTDTRMWTAGITANWLMFDSFVTRDQVRQSSNALRISRLNLEQTERSTRLQVNSAFLDVQNAADQIKSFQSTREQASRNVAVVRARFQSGSDRLIDVFDAETQARSVDLEYLGLLLDHLQDKDNLSQLVGVRLESIPP